MFKYTVKKPHKLITNKVKEYLTELGEEHVEEVKQRLESGAQGQWKHYYYRAVGSKVWSSNPGTPPRKHTGRLASQPIKIEDTSSGNQVSVKVSMNDKIGFILQTAKNSPFLEPRPFFDLIAELALSKLKSFLRDRSLLK